MSTLTKLVLGMMGQLRPKPAKGEGAPTIDLPPPSKEGGAPLMNALSERRSAREFSPRELPLQTLSDLLWAAYGVNRPDGGRTAPSALNAQEIDLYVALPSGAYLYDSGANMLQLVAGSDLRAVTGYQDFVDEAPLDLVFVADHSRMSFVPAGQRESYAYVAPGAISQYVYLFCASSGLATVIRMDQSRGDRRRAGAEPRSASAAVANRGILTKLSARQPVCAGRVIDHAFRYLRYIWPDRPDTSDAAIHPWSHGASGWRSGDADALRRRGVFRGGRRRIETRAGRAAQ
jgi:nitroreductase